jgi:hypothetical protein
VSVPKLYIETSPFNFYNSKESLKQEATRKLFGWIDQGRFDAYTSDAVLEEFKKAEPKLQDKLFAMIPGHRITVIETTDAAKALASVYVERNIIPANTTQMQCISPLLQFTALTLW